MNREHKVSEYKEFAGNYDKQVKEYDSYGHDVLFGMSFEFVTPDEKLLDIGIGTGLASIQFSKIGLNVYGLDASQEMLNACQAKSFTQALNLYDMNNEQIPYKDNYFNHVICCGVLHFMGDLSDLFKEVKRVMKPKGIFSFTIAANTSDLLYTKEDTAWGVPIYKHAMQYIMELLDANGLKLQKEQRLLIKGADKINYDMLFSALVAKLQ
jgi:ubiquinone/menaquinone biosynthesis C-methylase UbiE